MIYKVGKYQSGDLMSDLICDNYPMLLVMSRFGIDLGFGEDTIEEVCAKSGVDLGAFLAVVNVLIAEDKASVKIDYDNLSLIALTQYLHNSHSYFLDYKLPSIRRKLVEALDRSDDAVSMLIVNYYDEYAAEVRKHMLYEEEHLFPYITSIVNRTTPKEEYCITIYCEHHDKVESRLSELKGIMIKYYPAKTTNELTAVLYDIFSCERDLISHSDIEDYLLVPAIKCVETANR